MGWFFINIVLPVAVPAAFMLLARTANLPPAVAARTSLLNLVQDGQLGWVALIYAASCVNDVFAYLTSGSHSSPIHAWLAPLMAVAVVLITASGFLAALGALYPRRQKALLTTWRQRYALFAASAVCTIGAASLYSVIHFYLLPH